MSGPSLSEFAAAAAAAYDVPTGSVQPPTGMTLLTQQTIALDGFAAAAFVDSQGNIIVTFAGTVPGLSTYDTGTLAADAMLMNGQSPAALQDAIDLAQSVVNTYGSVYVDGHSLGGTEAEAACQALGPAP